MHDAELVERVWGDDLRIEGVVVERLDGADHLPRCSPSSAPARNAGSACCSTISSAAARRRDSRAKSPAPHVLITGTPYVDVWQAVRPAAVGISGWPEIPMGTDWKTGVCAALGVDDPRQFWRRILASVSSWKDLEQPLVHAVEQLIDFVTVEP